MRWLGLQFDSGGDHDYFVRASPVFHWAHVLEFVFETPCSVTPDIANTVLKLLSVFTGPLPLKVVVGNGPQITMCRTIDIERECEVFKFWVTRIRSSRETNAGRFGCIQTTITGAKAANPSM
jgi:hypothetical protein